MRWCYKGDLENNKLGPNGYIIKKLGNRHTITPITWVCTMFTLATNIEKRDMKFLTI